MSNDERKQHPHRFAYDGLDRVIHQHDRQGVLTSLVSHPKGLPFGDLKQLCALTDGNLSRHLQVLQAAEVVEISTGFAHNRPQTISRTTGPGRNTTSNLAVLEQVVQDRQRRSEALRAPPTHPHWRPADKRRSVNCAMASTRYCAVP